MKEKCRGGVIIKYDILAEVNKLHAYTRDCDGGAVVSAIVSQVEGSNAGVLRVLVLPPTGQRLAASKLNCCEKVSVSVCLSLYKRFMCRVVVGLNNKHTLLLVLRKDHMEEKGKEKKHISERREKEIQEI